MTALPLADADGWRPSRHGLIWALVLAAAVHGLLLLDFGFKPPAAPVSRPAMSLTLALTPQTQPAQTTAPAAAKPQTPPPATPARAAARPPQTAARAASHKAAPPPAAIMPQPAAAAPPSPPPRPLLTAESLREQIAQVGQSYQTRPAPPAGRRMQHVNAVRDHKLLASQYLQDWTAKVERTGNLNYPEAARHKGEVTTLTMEVGIDADGGIYSMRIVKPSGDPNLDEAAKRIVRMSAPFAALPYELLQEVNVLVITRVWKFSDQTGMTSR